MYSLKIISFLRYFLLIPLLLFCNDASSQNRDIELLRSINKKQTPAKTSFFTFCSNSDYIVPFAYPVVMFSIGKLGKKNPYVKESFFSSASLGTVCLLTYTLKAGIKRPRPYETYPDLTFKKPAKDFSFPSGHTSTAFCTATSISLYYNKWYVTLPAFLWAGTVSYSRMYLGMHFPTDILGGIILGTGIPLLFHFCKPVNLFLDKTGKAIFRY